MSLRNLSIQDPHLSAFCFNAQEHFRNYVFDCTAKYIVEGEKARELFITKEDVKNRQQYIYESFMRAIGGLPSSNTTLNPIITGKLQYDKFYIEKIIYESRPKNYVTGNLYIPNDINGPTGAILFLCGHALNGKLFEEYRIVCQILAKAGLVVFSIDPIGQGERISYYDIALKESTVDWGSFEHDYVGFQTLLLGQSLARYFLHDAMRAVDYLATRPEVDIGKIGVTGNSGGGMQTSLMMMGDRRIAAAAPCTYITSRKQYLYAGETLCAEQIWPGTTALGLGYEDILISMAPKPVLVLAVKNDFFPIEGTYTVVECAKRIWNLFESDNIGIFEDNAMHAFTHVLAKAAAEFFAKHLLGREVESEKKLDTEFELECAHKLQCTISGQVTGDFEDAEAVFESNCRIYDALEIYRKSLTGKEREKRAFTWLKEKLFLNRRPCNPVLKKIYEEVYTGLKIESYIWWAQKDVINHGYLIRDVRYNTGILPLTIAIWDEGTTGIINHAGWIRKTCCEGRDVLILDATGLGMLTPEDTRDTYERYRTGFILACDLVWLGDSLPALRTYDVIRALDVFLEYKNFRRNETKLYGYGNCGLYARLASAIDKRISGIETENSIESFKEFAKERYYENYNAVSVIFPGVLEYFDLPEIEWGFNTV